VLNMVTHGHDGLVADMAAGTGKLTRMLAGAGVAVIAVEPSAAMRTVLRSVTRVSVIAAIAEALPFANSTLACACVAQAFHHLHSAQAHPRTRPSARPGRPPCTGIVTCPPSSPDHSAASPTFAVYSAGVRFPSALRGRTWL